MKTSLIRYVATFLLVFTMVGFHFAMAEDANTTEYISDTTLYHIPGVVKKVETLEHTEPENDMTPIGTTQKITVHLSSPEFSGPVEIDNVISGSPYYDLQLTPGDRVYIHLETQNGEILAQHIEGYFRTPVVKILLGIIIAAFLFIGGRNSIRPLLIGIGILIVLTSWVIPSTQNGNTLTLTLFPGLLLTGLSVAYGQNKQHSLALLYASLLCLAIMFGVMTWIMNMAYLNGISSESMAFVAEAYPKLDFSNLLQGSILTICSGFIFYMTLLNSQHILKATNTLDSFQACLTSLREQCFQPLSYLVILSLLVFLGLGLPAIFEWMDAPQTKFLNSENVITFMASWCCICLSLFLSFPVNAFIFSRFLTNKPLEE